MAQKGAAASTEPVAAVNDQIQNTADMLNWQLYALRHNRSLRIAGKLARFGDTARDAFAMRRCSQAILYGQPSPEQPPIIEAVMHCHHSMCQVCRGERQVNWQRRIDGLIRRDMTYILDGNGQEYSEEQIARWDHRRERLEWRVAMSRDRETHESLMDQINRVNVKRDAAARPRTTTLYPYLITITIRNPEHIWTGPRNFCHVWEKDRPDPEIEIARQMAELEVAIREQERRVAQMYRKRGAKAERQKLAELSRQKKALERRQRSAGHANQLDEMLWGPWRRARESARQHPDSEWAKLWGHVVGGLWVTEITFNARAWTFHPHIHMLVLADVPYLANQRPGQDGIWRERLQPFFPQAMNVDVRRISDKQWKENPQAVVREVTKYLTKPEKDPNGAIIRDEGMPDWAYRELVKAEKGRRLINTFGSWRTPEPPWDPNAGTAPSEPITAGMHTLRVWNRRTKSYEIVGEWPATEDRPILGVAERLARYGRESYDLIQVAIAHAGGKIVALWSGQPYIADGVKKWNRDEITAAKRRYLIRCDPAGAEASGVAAREIDAALSGRSR